MLVLWDYENVSFSGLTPLHVRSEVLKITDGCASSIQFNVYCDTEQMNKSQRSGFLRAGWSIIDCPHKKSKQTVDMKIIFDVLLNPTNIVLISGDGDFVPLICVIREKGFKVFLLYDAQNQQQVCADLILSADVSSGVNAQHKDEDDEAVVDNCTLDLELVFWAMSKCKQDDGSASSTDVGELFHSATKGKYKDKTQRKQKFRAAVKLGIESGNIIKVDHKNSSTLRMINEHRD